jgi:hypothetical protein
MVAIVRTPLRVSLFDGGPSYPKNLQRAPGAVIGDGRASLHQSANRPARQFAYQRPIGEGELSPAKAGIFNPN